MLDRIKTYLGVEGVRLELEAPPAVSRREGVIAGRILLSTLRPQRVSSLALRLTERYSRGRGERKRIDEYVLGESEVPCGLDVVPGEEIVVPFVLRFAERRTAIERRLDRFGPLGSPLTKVALLSYAAESRYELTVMGTVAGVALQPVCSVSVTLE